MKRFFVKLRPLLRRFGISYKDYELISDNKNGASLIADDITFADSVLRGQYNEKATAEDIVFYDTMCMVSLSSVLHQNSLYRYYEEQLEKGNDIYTLAEKPYAHCDEWKVFADYRAEALKAAVADAGMTEAMTSAGAEALPFDVTGDKLCIMDKINVDEHPLFGDEWCDAFRSIFSPFDIAEKPEDVRYVL